MSIRLIHASTLELEVFSKHPPCYAILSHLWGNDEISFADILKHKSIKMLGHKASFPKVEGVCALAKKEGYDYVWVDTCCIDKSSSTELQAAINSMFEWYKSASKCYVYLSDVECESTRAETFNSEFCDSRWFKRGWTLQELLAPSDICFYNSRWEFLSTAKGLIGLISRITHIPKGVLTGQTHYLNTSIAQRMSWAATRETTAPEDIAYCLLGLFDVNMPLLYGEGSGSAFKRLQSEILKESDDESIFAWTGPADGSMIALSPSCFAKSGTIMPATRDWSFDPERPPYVMTNKGLQFEPLLIDSKYQYKFFYPSDKESQPVASQWKTILLILNCVKGSKKSTVAIQLEERAGTYHRLSGGLFVSNKWFKEAEIDKMAINLSHRNYCHSPKPQLSFSNMSSTALKAQSNPFSESTKIAEAEAEYPRRCVIFIRKRQPKSASPSFFSG